MAEDKGVVTMTETTTSTAPAIEVQSETGWEPQEEKALVRLIDFRIFPSLIMLFILNFIDRVNFANARLKGLEADLHLSDVDYQTCISILFVGYVGGQIPSNMVLNKVSRPSWYICLLVALWGTISALTGAVQNAGGAIAARFFLGLVESGFFAGAILFCSRWYKRDEIALRVALLSSGTAAASASGGLIAAGILGNMEGSGGIRAWRWLFIIEGSVTVFFALLSLFLLPDYPATTRWLSERQRYIAQARLSADVGMADEDDEGNALHGLKLAVMDFKVWILALCYFCLMMAMTFTYFFPTIAQSLGYGPIVTLLLTAPPWTFATLVSIANAWHADRTQERFFHFIPFPSLACVGIIISMTCRTVGPRYFSFFLMALGFCGSIMVLSWVPTTVSRPPAKRAAAIAIVNGLGNVGTIPASYVWPAKYRPYYLPSFGVTLAMMATAVLCALGLRFYLGHLNRKLDREDAVAFEVNETAVKHSAHLEGTDKDAVVDHAKERFRYIL